MTREGKGKRTAVWIGAALLALAIGAAYVLREDIRLWLALSSQFETLGKNEQGYHEFRHRETGIVFVYLPGGTCEVGTTDEEWYEHLFATEEIEGLRDDPKLLEELAEDYGEDRLERQSVEIAPFLIAKYELTNEVYEPLILSGAPQEGDETLPADELTRIALEEFWKATGLEIPNEYEWEYAALGGQTRTWWSQQDMTRYAWIADTCEDVQIVGTKEPNGFGLHDVFGNVSEWCLSDSQTGIASCERFAIRGMDVYARSSGTPFVNRYSVDEKTNIEPVAMGLRPVFRLPR